MKRSEALGLLQRDHQRRGLAARTLAQRLRSARRFLERLGKPVRQSKAEGVRAYLARRRAEGLGATTLDLELSHLRAFFSVVLESDPTEGLSVEHGGPKAPLVLSREAVARLLGEALRGPGLEAVRLRDRACLELLYGVGLRVSEAAAIEVTDLSLAEGTLVVRSAKRGKPRMLPLPTAALEWVERYLREGRPALRPRSGCLLVTRSGRRMSSRAVTSLVDRVGERAGVRVHAHALRRAVATHLVAAGVNVEAVRQLLGHVDLETTAVYVAVERSELRRAVGRLTAKPDAQDR